MRYVETHLALSLIVYCILTLTNLDYLKIVASLTLFMVMILLGYALSYEEINPRVSFKVLLLNSLVTFFLASALLVVFNVFTNLSWVAVSLQTLSMGLLNSMLTHAFLVAPGEELFKYGVYSAFKRFVGYGDISAFLAIVVWGMLHVVRAIAYRMNPMLVIYAFSAGILFFYSSYKTGTPETGILSHAMFNCISVAVSGG